MVTAIWAILIFCLLIFIHEFGHFITARFCGMTVHEFSIGMGPKIFGINKTKTAYSLRAFPLGGFVRLEGEDGESGDPNAFCNKSFIKRFVVLFSGAFMNILLGFLLFAIIFASAESFATNEIGTVSEGSAFYEAGVREGDKITYMKGKDYSGSVHSFRDVNFFVNINGPTESEITFERDGKSFTKTITPKPIEGSENPVYGFVAKVVDPSPGDALEISFWECIFVIKSVFLSLWWLITGFIPVSEISGPVAIVGQIGEAARYGWRTVFNLAGFISVNLGVMNLFPIPALDGGRILFLIIEKIRGKKMNPDKEGMINFVFFALLIFFMLFVTFGDVKKLF